MTLHGHITRAMAVLAALTFIASPSFAQNKKVFIDQDIGGATGTDNQSLMMLVQAPNIDVVGISIVAGDGQVKDSTAVDAADAGAHRVRTHSGGPGSQVSAGQLA